LLPFDRDDIREFARNWFTARAEHELEEHVIEKMVHDFITSLRGAGVGAMVRVPLLVAMAALVYERSSNSELPATRCDLYRDYTSLLLSARSKDLEQTAASSPQEPLTYRTSFHIWLGKKVPDLLLPLATAYVDNPSCSLMRTACDWVKEQLRAEGKDCEPEWQWYRLLHSLLISTSVLVSSGSDVEFMHHSIAEYFAADPQVCIADDEVLKSQLTDSASRSLALFILARSGKHATPLVLNLLESGDPLSAGHILAEGLKVEAYVRKKTLDGLLDRLRDEDQAAVECLSILGDLAIDHQVAHQLIRVAEDSHEDSWTRALIADTLAEMDPDLGMRLLREVATDRRIGHEQGRLWAAERLIIRGDEFADRISREFGRDTSRDAQQTRRFTEWMRRFYAEDALMAPEDRLREAIELSDRGDPIGTRILRQVASDSGLHVNERRAAARILMERRDLTGLNVLHEIAKDKALDPSERRLAALLLDGNDERTPSVVLRERARDRGIGAFQRRMAAELLTRRGDRAGIEVLHELINDESIDAFQRYEAARALAQHGDSIGVEYLEAMAQDYHGEYYERYSAATALAHNYSNAGTRALEELAADSSGDPWERRIAAQMLLSKTEAKSAIDSLTRMAVDESIAAEERYEAARTLLDKLQPSGFEILRALALSRDSSFRVRYLSGVALLERGDEVGLDVLRDLSRDATSMIDDRRLAARALAEYRDEVGLRTLREFARSNSANANERRQAALALAKLGDSEGVEILQQLLDG